MKAQALLLAFLISVVSHPAGLERGLRGSLGEKLGLQLKKQILLCNQELSKVCLLTAAYFGTNILDGT